MDLIYSETEIPELRSAIPRIYDSTIFGSFRCSDVGPFVGYGKERRVDLADHLAGILSEHRRTLAGEALKKGQ